MNSAAARLLPHSCCLYNCTAQNTATLHCATGLAVYGWLRAKENGRLSELIPASSTDHQSQISLPVSKIAPRCYMQTAKAKKDNKPPPGPTRHCCESRKKCSTVQNRGLLSQGDLVEKNEFRSKVIPKFNYTLSNIIHKI